MRTNMNKAAVYDTRFFIELYNTKNAVTKKKASEERQRRKRYVSAIVIHELYKYSLSIEGRETARLKISLLKDEFEVIPVNDQIAQVSAELRHKYQLSMGDSMIAATSLTLKAVCISDDPHFKQITEIETTWI
jgi:predicted nucleic acid-binding protein